MVEMEALLQEVAERQRSEKGVIGLFEAVP